jgi:hypothetical protein
MKYGTKAQEVADSFTYHAPKNGQIEKYKELRDLGKQLAFLILDVVPGGREQSTAITKLEETIMWANKGIAIHGE